MLTDDERHAARNRMMAAESCLALIERCLDRDFTLRPAECALRIRALLVIWKETRERYEREAAAAELSTTTRVGA